MLKPDDVPSSHPESRSRVGSASSNVGDGVDMDELDVENEELKEEESVADLPRDEFALRRGLPRDWRKGARRAEGIYKVKRFLKERMQNLITEEKTVTVEQFMQRLESTGCIKMSRMWQPAISLADVIQESGIAKCRKDTHSAVLEEFRNTGLRSSSSSSSSSSSAVQAGTANGKLQDDDEDDDDVRVDFDKLDNDTFLGRFRGYVKSGKHIMEMSVGYPVLALSYWLGVLYSDSHDPGARRGSKIRNSSTNIEPILN